jgi:hypothetical protein
MPLDFMLRPWRCIGVDYSRSPQFQQAGDHKGRPYQFIPQIAL